MKLAKLVGPLAFALLIAGPASTAVFDFSYTDGVDTFGSGEFFTNDISSPFLITNVTGSETYQGVTEAITGVAAVNSYAANDNILSFPASPFVTFSGISFTTATDAFNIGFVDPIYVILQQSTDPGGFWGPPPGIALTNFSVSAVPEPSTWAMMLIGLAGFGFAFRQSRRKASFA
jgi:PEP-CTERM motif